MLNFSQLLVGSAWAQSTAPSSPSVGGFGSSSLMSFVPLVLIFAVFYVLIIRPQQKKIDEQNKMVKGLQRGDRVVTSGGIHGKIVKLDGEDNLMVEVAENVVIKLTRASVQGLAAKTQPVIANDGEDADKKS